MGIILFIALVGYIFWVLQFRNTYIGLKYGKETGIDFTYGLDKSELYEKLKTELTYPSLKEVFYDENGSISLRGKHRSYTLRIEDNRLYICKQGLSYKNEIEEAECLKAYIEKLFNPESEKNPRAMYEAMTGYRKKAIIITTVIFSAFIIAAIITLKDSDAGDAVSSKSISTSYLSEFSTTETIGEAFEDFFSNPKWKSYSIGAEEYVDFSGGCTFGEDDNANMIITFELYDDSFEIVNIKVNGEELPFVMHYGILSTIYEE